MVYFKWSKTTMFYDKHNHCTISIPVLILATYSYMMMYDFPEKLCSKITGPTYGGQVGQMLCFLRIYFMDIKTVTVLLKVYKVYIIYYSLI